MIEFLTFILWELILFVTAIGFVYSIIATGTRRGNELTDGSGITAILGVKLFLGCAIPQWLAFAGGSSVLRLYLIAIILLSISIFALKKFGKLNLTDLLNFLRLNHRADAGVVKLKQDGKVLIAPIMVGLVLMPLIATSFMPVIETDSIFHSVALWGMLDGAVSPLDFPFHYVAFWEAGYVPGLILSDSQLGFPYFSFQAVLLLIVSSYTLARRLKFSGLTALLIASSVALSGHMWGSAPTGVATIKNDMIYGAGLMTFVTGLLFVFQSEKAHRIGFILMGVGASFASVKFSGPPAVIIIFLLAAIVWRKHLFLLPTRFVYGVLSIAIAVTLSTGVYYIANWVRFGNPLYPFQISLGPFHFKGTTDYDGTSILDHAADPETWALFFGLSDSPEGGVAHWPYLEQGASFPFIFLFGFMACIFLLIRKVSRKYESHQGVAPRVNMSANVNNTLFLTAVAIVSWFLFMRGFWTAGATPDDFFYLRTQASLRYAVFQTQLSLFLSVFGFLLLFRGREMPGQILLVGVIIDRILCAYLGTGTARYASVFDATTPFWSYAWAWVGVIVIAGVILWCCRRFCVVLRLPATSLFVLLVIPVGIMAKPTYASNVNYEPWPANIVDKVFDGSGVGDVYIAQVNAPAVAWPNVFAATGVDQQLTFQGIADINALGSLPNSDAPQFLSVACNRSTQYNIDNVTAFDGRFSDGGFHLVAYDKCSAIFMRLPLTPWQDSILEKPLTRYASLWEVCALGFKDCRPDVQLADGYFATTLPAAIWKTENGKISRVSMPQNVPEIMLLAENNSNPTSAQAFYPINGYWRPDMSDVADSLKSNIEFQFPHPSNSHERDQLVYVSSEGKYDLERVDAETGESILRITALEDTRWLAIGVRANSLLARKGMFYARVKSPNVSTFDLAMESFNFESGELISPPSKRFHSGLDLRADGWTYFEFGSDLGSDYSAVAILDVKAGQIIEVESLLFVANLQVPLDLLATPEFISRLEQD